MSCAWRLPLRGVPAYLRYLVAVASLSQSSLRVSLAYLIYLPWRVCPVGAPLVAHEGHFPPLGVLAYLGYLGGRLVPWEGLGGGPGRPRGIQSSGHRVHIIGHFVHKLPDQAYLGLDRVQALLASGWGITFCPLAATPPRPRFLLVLNKGYKMVTVVVEIVVWRGWRVVCLLASRCPLLLHWVR